VFSFHHHHTLSLTPELSRQFDRFLDLWERSLSDGMTDDEQQAVLDRARGQVERLRTVTRTDEPPVK
jgi:hypothetical protein